MVEEIEMRRKAEQVFLSFTALIFSSLNTSSLRLRPFRTSSFFFYLCVKQLL